MKNYKKKQIRNKKFMEFVANQNCSLYSHSSYPCSGGVQAHHLLKPWQGYRGMGLRAGDNNCLPLCQRHHAHLHDKHGNEDTFWTLFKLPEDYGRIISKSLWNIFTLEGKMEEKLLKFKELITEIDISKYKQEEYIIVVNSIYKTIFEDN